MTLTTLQGEVSLFSHAQDGTGMDQQHAPNSECAIGPAAAIAPHGQGLSVLLLFSFRLRTVRSAVLQSHRHACPSLAHHPREVVGRNPSGLRRFYTPFASFEAQDL